MSDGTLGNSIYRRGAHMHVSPKRATNWRNAMDMEVDEHAWLLA
jgi:hypothetical protein